MIQALNELGFTNGMITSAGITILLCVISILAGHNLKMVPSGLQNAVEWAIGGLYNFFEDIMGKDGCKKYFPLVASLFIYIVCCNYSGLLPGSGHIPGLHAPTASINCTMALAVIVFIAFNAIGIKEHHGLRYYKHWLQPFAFLLPLMLVEDFVKPVSLTFRLYGNVFGEETVTHELFKLFPVGLPVVMQFLSVLMGLIQALVFALLAAIYIKEAMPEEEEHL